MALVTVLVVLVRLPARAAVAGRRCAPRSRRRSWPAWRSSLLGQLFLFAAPRIVGTAALAGSLATAFIALAWLSFSYQGLLYGAAWVRVRDDALTGGQASRGVPAETG